MQHQQQEQHDFTVCDCHCHPLSLPAGDPFLIFVMLFREWGKQSPFPGCLEDQAAWI